MSRLKREGNPPSGQWASPVPQAWDPSISDFRELTGQNLGGGRFGADGVQWGKTASGLFVPIKVTNDGTQEVQLSGNIVERFTQSNIEVAAGGHVTVTLPGTRASKWLILIENTSSSNQEYSLSESVNIGGYASQVVTDYQIALNKTGVSRFMCTNKTDIMDPSSPKIRITNTSATSQTYKLYVNLYKEG